VVGLLFAACSDAGAPTEPAGALRAEVITCQASVRAGTLTCTTPSAPNAGASAISADLVLGGQGTYVALRSSAVSYNAATSTFQADVTVQNLTAYPMGTADGSTVTGVRVFFHSGPTVTSGLGGVTVKNADGTGTFTGASQPYFLYNEILQTAQVSSAKTWQWNVPNTVTAFAFQVLVDAAAPQEHTVLRWLPQVDLNGFNGVWGSASNDVFAVAASGSIWHYDGMSWRAQLTGRPGDLWGVGGSGAADVFAVGDSGILHYDGVSWSAQASGTTQTLFAVWGSAPTAVFAVGKGGTILHYDGTSWRPQTSGTTEELWGV